MNTILKTVLIAGLLLPAACAQTPASQPPGPPPPQNLVGSTDELQLVTEIALDQARQRGADQILLILEIDQTLVSAPAVSAAGDPCRLAALRPVQGNAAEQVQRAQAANIRVIAVTARGPECAADTADALDRLGFDFSGSAWPPQAGYPEPLNLPAADRPVAYTQGIYFVDGQDRGALMSALLDNAGVPGPVLIIAVDNDRQHLSALMKVFSWTGTKVQTWHYTRQG